MKPLSSCQVIIVDNEIACTGKTSGGWFYRAGPLIIAINFPMWAKYDCNDGHERD